MTISTATRVGGATTGSIGTPGARVVVAVAGGQRPGVRRGPEEHDGEQRERGRGERAGDRRPADQHGHAPGDAAPDDVLRRPPLEQHRVDDDVEGDRRQRQAAGQPVGGGADGQDRYRAEHQAEDQRAGRRDLVPGQRAAAGASHDRVDVAVDVAVEGIGAAGCQRAAEHRDQRRPTISAGRRRRAPSTGRVVTSSSSMIRGLVSATYAPIRLRCGRGRAPSPWRTGGDLGCAADVSCAPVGTGATGVCVTSPG